MIEYLRGKLVASGPGQVILELGGVALQVRTPASLGEQMEPFIGQEVVLHTRLVLREDEACIYGFRSPDERNLFNLVLGVSGFGPRLALALLGVFTASHFYVAVLEENITLLCQAPGVGRKVAQRLVLELKEKLPRAAAQGELHLDAAAPAQAASREEIVEALCVLGYSRVEAAAAVSGAAQGQDNLTGEDLLKLALKNMASP